MTFQTLLVAIFGLVTLAFAQVDLGTAASFGILASTAISNTGATVVNGDLGIFPNSQSSITGFPPGLSGTIYAANGVADQARQDAQVAYSTAASLATTSQVGGADIGGQTLVAGTYTSPSSLTITGPLTLDGQNNPNSLFVFQIGSTLTTATSSSIVLINGAQACNIFFQVGSSATLGTSTTFNGNILALTSISLGQGVTVNGGLYALNGAVTLIDDLVTAQRSCVPELQSSTSAISTPTLLESSSIESEIPITTEVTISTPAPIDSSITIISGDITTTIVPGDDTTSAASETTVIQDSSEPPFFSNPLTGIIPTPTLPVIITFPSTDRTSTFPGSDTTTESSTITTLPIVSMSLASSTLDISSTTSWTSSFIESSSRSSRFANSSFVSTVPEVLFSTSTSKPISFSQESLTTSSLSSTDRISTLSSRPVTRTSSLISSTETTLRTTESSKLSTSSESSSVSRYNVTSKSYGTSKGLYSVYVSTTVRYLGYTTRTTSQDYPQYTTTDTRPGNVSTTYNSITVINGTPCTTLSYYEPSCSCNKTTIVPVAFTPTPEPTRFGITTVSGVPCTMTRYFEEECACVRSSMVPISAVTASADIATIVDNVPCVTSRYYEPSCDCIQITTIPVRIASADEVAVKATATACAQTSNYL